MQSSISSCKQGYLLWYGRLVTCLSILALLLLNPAVLVPLFLASMTVGMLVSVWLPWSEPYLVVALVAVLVLTLVLSMLVATKMAVLLAVLSHDRQAILKRAKTIVSYAQKYAELLENPDTPFKDYVHIHTSLLHTLLKQATALMSAHAEEFIEDGRSVELLEYHARMYGHKPSSK